MGTHALGKLSFPSRRELLLSLENCGLWIHHHPTSRTSISSVPTSADAPTSVAPTRVPTCATHAVQCMPSRPLLSRRYCDTLALRRWVLLPIDQCWRRRWLRRVPRWYLLHTWFNHADQLQCGQLRTRDGQFVMHDLQRGKVSAGRGQNRVYNMPRSARVPSW